MVKMRIDYRKLAISMVICLLAGAIGSIFTMPAIAGWYSTLSKPAWTPPNWAFGPVWTTLYILMGISLYLIWNTRVRGVKTAMGIFAAQLVLNVLWSFLFFGLQSPLLGMIGIVALWIAILATIIVFYRISRPAAYLLLPYIVWVTIASALNYSVLVLNT